MGLQKALRTLQHYVPGGRDGREALSRMVLRVGRRVHDPDFAALRFFPPRQLLLDVGANYGQSAASMRLMQPTADIISYEPNADLAAKITDLSQHDPQITVRPLGLADAAGTFTLYVPYYGDFPYPGLASLNEEEARSWLSAETLYFFRAGNVRVKRVQCQITTLDREALAPYFIKIDVQGAELAMLEGSRETLDRHHPVLLIESPGRNTKIGDLLARFGYEEYAFTEGVFVRGTSDGTNSFFLTADRQIELESDHPGLFVT